MIKLPTRTTNQLVGTVIILVPFHAFFTVWLSTIFGHFTELRLWDDVLLLVLFLVVISWLVQDHKLRQSLLASKLFRLIAAYAFVTLAFGVVALLRHNVTLKALAYSLLVNLRFLVWFLCVWIVELKSSWLGKRWRDLVFWPLLIVTIFAALQFFVLSPNFLAHFGYNKATTYTPITTLNQNTSTIRAQSFLRGANPFGAYLVLGLSLLAACIVRKKQNRWKLATLFSLSALSIFLSFSRSAWIGAFVAVGIVVFLGLKKRRHRVMILGVTGTVIVVLSVAAFSLRHSTGFQDAIFHVSNHSTAKITSNAGHVSALHNGLSDLIHRPFGRGPGSAGPASWYNAPHPVRNPENYYLEVAQELGWLGLVLFVVINLYLGLELWKKRADTLALGLLAALIGLTIVNQLTYAWADDTLAFIFWGLAGISYGKFER